MSRPEGQLQAGRGRTAGRYISVAGNANTLITGHNTWKNVFFIQDDADYCSV